MEEPKKTVENILEQEIEQRREEIERLRTEVANLQSVNNALKETIVRTAMISVDTLQIGG